MLREQAVAILKELIAADLIHPIWMAIGENTLNHYELRFKGEINQVSIEEFLQKRNLALEQNKEKDYFAIYKSQTRKSNF